MQHFQNGCYQYSHARFNAYCKASIDSKVLHQISFRTILNVLTINNNFTMVLVAVDVQYHTAYEVKLYKHRQTVHKSSE